MIKLDSGKGEEQKIVRLLCAGHLNSMAIDHDSCASMTEPLSSALSDYMLGLHGFDAAGHGSALMRQHACMPAGGGGGSCALGHGSSRLIFGVQPVHGTPNLADLPVMVQPMIQVAPLPGAVEEKRALPDRSVTESHQHPLQICQMRHFNAVLCHVASFLYLHT
jgi:hypothetical protein